MATKWTLVPTVLPFAGLDTVTPANADVAAKKTTTTAVEIRACFFIFRLFSPVGMIGQRPVKLYNSEGYAGLAGTPSVFGLAKPPASPDEKP